VLQALAVGHDEVGLGDGGSVDGRLQQRCLGEWLDFSRTRSFSEPKWAQIYIGRTCRCRWDCPSPWEPATKSWGASRSLRREHGLELSPFLAMGLLVLIGV